MRDSGLKLCFGTLALLAIASLASRATPYVDSRATSPVDLLSHAALRGGAWSGAPSSSHLVLANVAWRPIAGSRATLTTRLQPGRAATPAPPASKASTEEEPDAAEAGSLPPMVVHWTLPLVSRFLTGSRRLERMSPDLQDAINRIEAIYDTTRLDGPFTDSVPLRIWPGTATMSNVFGEHWRLASDDPNVNRKVRSIGVGWWRAPVAPCADFTKNRQHEVGETTLTELDEWDCRRLQARQAPRFNDAAFIEVVVAPLSVPVFAAPMPGSRLSSQDFWAAQRSRINAIQAQIRRKWQAAMPAKVADPKPSKGSPVKVSANR